MGFFADSRDEDLEEQEARELDGQFITKSAASRAYMRTTRIFPKAVKLLLLTCVIATYLLFFFRVQTGKAPRDMRQFIFNADSVYMSATRPNDFAVYSQKQEANIQSVKVNSAYSFTVQTSHILYAPTSGQIQFVVRYNKSMQKSLNAYYERAVDTPIAGELFTYALQDEDGRLYTDFTLLGGQERNVNVFRHLSFGGILFDVDTELTLLVTDRRNPNFDEPLLEMSVYRAVMESERVDAVCPDGLCLYLAP